MTKIVTKIKAISVKQKSEGKIAFLTKDDEWLNIKAEENILDTLLEKILQKGNIIGFDLENGIPKNFILKEKAVVKEITKENNSGIIDIKGKDFMTYEELLNQAHKKGKFSMEIIDSWVSEDMKMSWCKVRLKLNEQVFDGFGSSTPSNTGTMTSDNPIEMAHTRAKSRALRDFLNIKQLILDETK